MTALSSSYYSRYEISKTELKEMYHIFTKYYDNTDYKTFISDLDKKTGVFIAYRKDTKAIVGFTTILKMKMRVNGKKIIGVFSGDTIIEKEFWGKNALNNKIFFHFIKQLFLHPFTPVYWFLISKGYKTYLIISNNFLNYYPCVSKEQHELSDITKAYCSYLFNDYYDQKNNLIDFGQNSQCLKYGIAEITEEMCRKNPKIAFFVKNNKTWAKGTELPCVGLVNWKVIIYHAAKPIRKWLRNERKQKFIQNEEMNEFLQP